MPRRRSVTFTLKASQTSSARSRPAAAITRSDVRCFGTPTHQLHPSDSRFFYRLFILCRLCFYCGRSPAVQSLPVFPCQHSSGMPSRHRRYVLSTHFLLLYPPNSHQAQIPKFTDVSKATKNKHYVQTGSVEQMFPYVHNLLVLLLRSLRLVWSVWICWVRKSQKIWFSPKYMWRQIVKKKSDVICKKFFTQGHLQQRRNVPATVGQRSRPRINWWINRQTN